MNIDQTTQIMLDKGLAQDAHEASQHHQLWLFGVDQGHQLSIVSCAVVKTMVGEHHGFNASLVGSEQTLGIAAIADHRPDVDRQLATRLAVDYRLQVAAIAGDEHHYR